MTNREKLAELSGNIKNLNKDFLKLDELITEDGFGDAGPNELEKYQNLPVAFNKALVDYHAFAVKIVHDKLELDEEFFE